MPSQRTVYELNAPAPALVDAALAGSRREVFWLQDSTPAPRFDPLVGAATADLTVVGGGYAGLWTAVRAKRRNPAARVVLRCEVYVGGELVMDGDATVRVPRRRRAPKAP